MKVAIVGSRNFRGSISLIHDYIYMLPPDTTIVSGRAIGVDSYAESIANHRGLSTLIFRPQWNKFGPKAGFIRNELIVEAADIIVAFWDGKSRGTHDTIMKAKRSGKPVKVVYEDGNCEFFNNYGQSKLL